jgi:glyoxylase-like metal-dependent hydrolase (beta-lactamase superfamily II)
LGGLSTDAAGILSGANTFPYGMPPQSHERRDLIMISVLIFHPSVGLILFDVGSSEDIISNWDSRTLECLPRGWEKDIHGLPAAIRATGAGDIKDVKVVVMSHLHMDHAGGLENFFDTGRCPQSDATAI